MKKKPTKHVFVCINSRDGKRKSCGEKGSKIRTKLLRLLAETSSESNIRINKSGCLGLCENGPSMVIYPQKTWYKKVKIKDCEEILNKSIINDDAIKRLEISEDSWEK